MAKQSEKKDPEERARRKYAKAQMRLSAAQDRFDQVREKGKQDVEKARLKAAQRLAKVAERVERRSEILARAEAALHSKSKPATPESVILEPSVDHAPRTPVEAAERLENTEYRAVAQADEERIVVPGSIVAEDLPDHNGSAP